MLSRLLAKVVHEGEKAINKLWLRNHQNQGIHTQKSGEHCQMCGRYVENFQCVDAFCAPTDQLLGHQVSCEASLASPLSLSLFLARLHCFPIEIFSTFVTASECGLKQTGIRCFMTAMMAFLSACMLRAIQRCWLAD